MTCRVIADLTFKEGEISKVIERGNGPEDFQVTAKRKGFTSKGPDGWVAQIMSALADEPKFSWSEVQGSWH